MEILKHDQNRIIPCERKKEIDDQGIKHHSPSLKSCSDGNLLSGSALFRRAQMSGEQCDRLGVMCATALEQSCQLFHFEFRGILVGEAGDPRDRSHDGIQWRIFMERRALKKETPMFGQR